VEPELSSSAVDELPILKADALKFLTILRSQLPTPVILSTFGNIVSLLGSDSNVVHSYAAIAIERLLASKVSPCLSENQSGHSILHSGSRCLFIMEAH